MKKKFGITLLLLFSFAPTKTHINRSILKNYDDLRDFDDPHYASVLQTYKLNHTQQTLAFVLAKKEEYCNQSHATMTMWEVALKMSTFIDESDPDLGQPQIVHAIQVAEAMRKDGLSKEWIVAGFIHDFGKVLYFFDEPQWAVVGDTFPVGCAFSNKIVFHNLFTDNPDTTKPLLNTKHGIYQPQCGLENIHMSWGHDEYLYQVIRNSRLPKAIKYAIRFHSFYPHHEHNAYAHFLNEYDKQMLKWVQLLNHYDLYTKVDESIDVDNLLPYYKNLVEQFFPTALTW